MPAAATAYAAYRNAELDGLTQRDLIVKLYQAAERSLRNGQANIRAKKPGEAHFDLVHANKIFAELASTLNYELGGEIARNLGALYTFIMTTISEANLRKDADRIETIMPIVSSLREAWQQVPEEHANVTAMPAGERHAVDLQT